MALLAVGVGTALLYAVWVLWVPLLPTNLYVPLLDLGKITGYTWRSAILFLSLVLTLYAFYALGYWLVSRGRANTVLVLALAGLFCLELVIAYPATAVDLFGYVAHGRLLAIHHVNPFSVVPNEFRSDPIIPYLVFPDEPSQYGPVWVLLNGGLALVAQGNLLTEVVLYKVVGAVAHVAGAAVIYHIARALDADGPCARACAYLYAWNPMLLWEMVGNAHNDGAMMLCGLVAAWFFVRHKHLFVWPALAIGALIKIPVAAIAPVLFIGAWRANRATATEGALLGLALAGVVYRPFWIGPSTLTVLRRTDLFTASLGSMLRLVLTPGLGQPDATTIARWVSLGAFLAVVVWAIALATRAATNQDFVRLSHFTLLGGLLLATTWYQAWYVAWPLALGAALPETRRHVEVALLSLGGLLQYFVFIYVWVMGLLPPGDNLAVQTAAYVCIVGPLLIGIAVRSSTPSRSGVYRRA